MSSAVYLTPRTPVKRSEWEVFGEEVGITYSPNTVGRNVYYQGQVEVKFGASSNEELPVLFRLEVPSTVPNREGGRFLWSIREWQPADYGDGIPTERGQLDFEAARPSPTAERITVSSYHGSNLSAIADLVKEIVTRWPCEVRCDEELTSRLRKRGIEVTGNEDEDSDEED